MEKDGKPLNNGVVEIHTLDVGQADARLVITGDGELVLGDANVEYLCEKLDEVLAGREIKRTANGEIPITLLTTHLHNDHVKDSKRWSGNTKYNMLSSLMQTDIKFVIQKPVNQKKEW